MRNILAIAVIFVSHNLRADVITFTPQLDADNEANTSDLTPYSASTTQSNAPVGLPDNGIDSAHSDTFFFSDAATGILFSFDVAWTANGPLNPTTGVLGIGAGASNISGTESLSIAVSGLAVDLSGYVSNSVGSIANAVLDSASVAFDSVSFTSWNDDTIVNITGASSEVAYDENSGNFNLGLDGLTESESFLFFLLNAGSSDPDFTISATEFAVTLDLSEAAAVPEPKQFFGLLLLAFCVSLFAKRRVHSLTSV